MAFPNDSTDYYTFFEFHRGFGRSCIGKVAYFGEVLGKKHSGYNPIDYIAEWEEEDTNDE